MKDKKENRLRSYSNLFPKAQKQLKAQNARKANRKIHRRRINNGNQYLLPQAIFLGD